MSVLRWYNQPMKSQPPWDVYQRCFQSYQPGGELKYWELIHQGTNDEALSTDWYNLGLGLFSEIIKELNRYPDEKVDILCAYNIF